VGEADRDRGFARQREAQRRAWLALSHRERLAWLEEAKRFAAAALAAAARRRREPEAGREEDRDRDPSAPGRGA